MSPSIPISEYYATPHKEFFHFFLGGGLSRGFSAFYALEVMLGLLDPCFAGLYRPFFVWVSLGGLCVVKLFSQAFDDPFNPWWRFPTLLDFLLDFFEGPKGSKPQLAR